MLITGLAKTQRASGRLSFAAHHGSPSCSPLCANSSSVRGLFLDAPRPYRLGRALRMLVGACPLPPAHTPASVRGLAFDAHYRRCAVIRLQRRSSTPYVALPPASAAALQRVRATALQRARITARCRPRTLARACAGPVSTATGAAAYAAAWQSPRAMPPPALAPASVRGVAFDGYYRRCAATHPHRRSATPYVAPLPAFAAAMQRACAAALQRPDPRSRPRMHAGATAGSVNMLFR
ncbi:hypothetical protein GGX14DRAFT_574577 [Mycena pura]|uniref:Uncharacterized protein n=1 Tax=Mycena pura TaxID=153505 RepID=A0AAD6Y6P7_9AGAR|nr:hypothetical protein GGX14DRAFT_574577 [Mycena pura]